MEQFLLVAAAHFLALLSPGPDFFLIARTSASAGWRVASGACLGIALANGVFILAAFTGVSVLQAGSGLFILRHSGRNSLTPGRVGDGKTAASWRLNLGMGFVSGILNPKNALFYASLASMLAGGSTLSKMLYGAWMFAAVLGWDLLVALAIGNRRVLRRFAQVLPWLERASGVMLMLLASAVLLHLARG
jgi:threonine/homoserine/homoserine lactone efflux protein